MAETLVSPGVLARENDQSFITQQPVQVGAAIVGPTVKGPVEIPTIVTSYSDYQNRFGTTFESGSDEYSFMTNITAYNYFQNGGNTMLVTRVVSGSSTWSFSSASVMASEGNTSGPLSTTTNNLLSATINAFNITGSALGIVPNINPTTNGSGTGAEVQLQLLTSQSFGTITVTDAGSGYEAGDTLTIPSASAGATLPGGTDMTFTLVAANIVTDKVAFTLEALDKGIIFNNSGSTPNGSQLITGGSGSLYSGSSDNVRWEIANSSKEDGNFNLLIRQGNDNDNNKIVLESWTNLSLDPKADNYIAKVIGDQHYNYNVSENYIEITGSYANASRYVRVKSVTSKTPDYFNNAGNAKSEYTGSIPAVGSGSDGGTFSKGSGDVIPSGRTMNLYGNINATDTQGLVGTDYTNMLNLLSNQDDYQFNLLVTPGLIDTLQTSQMTTALNNTQMRGDSIYIMDLVPYASTITAATTQAQARNSSYGAAYWPWLQTIDPDLGDQVWVPASAMIPGVYAFNDNASEPWFAPAGINRGGLTTVIRPERKLSQANRDSLYQNKVNPIASFPGVGTVVYGQKTLQRQASALDRVNVRRLLIALKSYIGQVAQTLVFEQNTAATRNNFLAIVNPYLETVVQRQGLYAFKVVMDDSNNTPDVVDRNQMIGAIYLQPTKTAEFIILDFNVLPTGATFPS
jgi:uncharacterized protein